MNDNTQTPAERIAMFQRLRDLLSDCKEGGCSKHDQVIALLVACMEEGINNGSNLVGVVASLRFNPRHVGKVLHDNVGQLWHRDGNRFYTALPPLAAIQ